MKKFKPITRTIQADISATMHAPFIEEMAIIHKVFHRQRHSDDTQRVDNFYSGTECLVFKCRPRFVLLPNFDNLNPSSWFL